jgi:hypothetical protein
LFFLSGDVAIEELDDAATNILVCNISGAGLALPK